MYWDPAAIANIYAERERTLRALSAMPVVEASQIRALDRLGLCEVANTLWARCTDDAREFLRHHSHPHVRSCATLADTAA